MPVQMKKQCAGCICLASKSWASKGSAAWQKQPCFCRTKKKHLPCRCFFFVMYEQDRYQPKPEPHTVGRRFCAVQVFCCRHNSKLQCSTYHYPGLKTTASTAIPSSSPMEIQQERSSIFAVTSVRNSSSNSALSTSVPSIL